MVTFHTLRPGVHRYIMIGSGNHIIPNVLIPLPEAIYDMPGDSVLSTPPTAGPKDRFGERTCFHHNASGAVVVLPDGYTTSVPKDPKRRVSYSMVNVVHSPYATGKYPAEYQVDAVVPFGTNICLEAWYERTKDDLQTVRCQWMYRGWYCSQNSQRTVYRNGTTAAWTRPFVVACRQAADGSYETRTAYSITANFRNPFSIDPATADRAIDDPMITGKASGAYLVVGPTSDIYLHSVRLRITELLSSAPQRYHLRYPSELDTDVAVSCLNQARPVDTNMWSLLGELRNLGKSFSDMAETLSRAITKRNAKAFADLDLSTRYGLKLTYKDVTSTVRRLSRRFTFPNGYARARATASSTSVADVFGERSSWTYQSSLKIWYNPTPRNPIDGTLQLLYGYRVLPSFEDVWDLVPFSFVVDWFLNISATLRSIDDRTWAQVLDVESVLSTRKSTISLSATEIQVSVGARVAGQITLTYYTRIVGKTFPSIPFSSPLVSGPFTHWVEGSALIIQAFA